MLDENSENDYGRNYGNGNSKMNSQYQSNGFHELKNGSRKGSNTDICENGFRSNNKNNNYKEAITGDVKFASPYRSYGSSDILVKSSTYFFSLCTTHNESFILFFFNLSHLPYFKNQFKLR